MQRCEGGSTAKIIAEPIGNHPYQHTNHSPRISDLQNIVHAAAGLTVETPRITQEKS